MKAWLLVAAGGGGGAMLRHLVGILCKGAAGGFPVATLTVNVIGCFFIGLAVDMENETRLLVVTGLLGGFTTYSAFGLESLQLLRQSVGLGLLHIGLHLVFGLLAVILGMESKRLLF